jgi:hypothetical protein
MTESVQIIIATRKQIDGENVKPVSVWLQSYDDGLTWEEHAIKRGRKFEKAKWKSK